MARTGILQHRREPVDAFSSLLSDGNEIGDTRRVLDTGYVYRWNGNVWIQDGVSIPGSLTNYLGSWDANTNTPTITSGVGISGDWYIVSVAGTTTIDGISTWGVGDYIWFDGTQRQKIDNQTPVDYQAQIDDLYAFAVAMGASL